MEEPPTGRSVRRIVPNRLIFNLSWIRRVPKPDTSFPLSPYLWVLATGSKKTNKGDEAAAGSWLIANDAWHLKFIETRSFIGWLCRSPTFSIFIPAMLNSLRTNTSSFTTNCERVPQFCTSSTTLHRTPPLDPFFVTNNISRSGMVRRA